MPLDTQHFLIGGRTVKYGEVPAQLQPMFQLAGLLRCQGHVEHVEHVEHWCHRVQSFESLRLQLPPGPISAILALCQLQLHYQIFTSNFQQFKVSSKAAKVAVFSAECSSFGRLGHFLGDGSGVPGSAWLQRCQSGTASSSGPAGALHLWGQWDGADALPAGAGMCPASTTGWRSRGTFLFQKLAFDVFFCLRKIPMQSKTWPPWSDKVWVNFWIIQTFRLLSPDAV